MTLLPRRSLLAIAAVVDVALHARPVPVTAKALASRHHLPPRRLETVLQALVRHAILKGVRGPRGGYELARERRRVSLGDIVRASQTAPTESERKSSAAPDRSPLIEVVIQPAIAAAGELYLAQLDNISVEDLCQISLGATGQGGDVNFTI